MLKFHQTDLKPITHEEVQQLGEWVRLDVAGSILVNLCGFDIDTTLDRLIATARAGEVRAKAPKLPEPQHQPPKPGQNASDQEEVWAILWGMWLFDHEVCLKDILRWAKYSPPIPKSRGGRPSHELKGEVIDQLILYFLHNPQIKWAAVKANQEEITMVFGIIDRLGGETIEETTARAWISSAKKKALSEPERLRRNPGG